MSTTEIPYKFLVNATPPERGNVTASVTAALRHAIVTLDLKPGEILDKGAICDRLGVSRFPVSEAFARLQAEGLVEIMPQRGTMVSRVRIADVVEFMLIRKALEGEAIRVLMAHRPEGVLEELESVLDDAAIAAKKSDHEMFHNLDVRFHEVLFDAMQFSRIRDIIDSARANLTRGRLLILDRRRLQVTQAEHKDIVDAIASGKTESAVAAMRLHIDNVTAEFIEFARKSPSLFADPERVNEDIYLLD
jgi:GntR family transcriptional regulator, rspAB operon transcriptional repressor